MIKFGIISFLFINSIRSHNVLDEVPLVDGHNDLPYNLYKLLENDLTTFKFDADLSAHPTWGLTKCDTCHTDLVRIRKGKLGAQFWVAYVSCDIQYKDAIAKTLEQIDVIKRLVNKYRRQMEFVTTADGIMAAFDTKKIGSLIGVEGGHSMDSRLGILRMFYDLGVRYMTLTHACNTPWADNSYVDDTTPVHNLTDYGRIVISEMNRLGMIVDLSHVSHAVMNEAIAHSIAPVIFSHSSAYALTPHVRNVRDDTLKLVMDRRGVVMVNFYSVFITTDGVAANATIDDVIAHINYIADLASVDCVGIGADYDGVNMVPKGLEDVSKYPDLFNKLVESNEERWTDENLKKLAYGNLYRVFKTVEKVRDVSRSLPPNQKWIPFEDLDTSAKTEPFLWKCRTLLNNSSPYVEENSSNNLAHASPIAMILIIAIMKVL